MFLRGGNTNYSRQVSYNTAGTVVSLFCQWVIMMAIPRITNFSDAGVFAVALSICSILNIFATFSINHYQISDQYVRYKENEYRSARTITIIISFILCFAVFVAFDYTTEQMLVILLYMVYRNFLHYAYLYTATLQIRERLDYVGKCTMLEGVLSLVSFLAVFYVTHDLVISVAAMAILGGGTFLISLLYGYKKIVGKSKINERADRSVVKSLLLMGIPLLVSGVAPIVITALPKLLLQMFDGDEITGIFSTLSAPTIIVPTLITGVFTPFIVYFSNVSRSGNIALLRKQYLKMVLLILVFGAVCFIISRLAGGYLFEMLYGEDIVPYVGYFEVLMVGIALYSIGMCGITVLITKEQGRAAAISSMLALVIGIAIFLVAIPSGGIDGATYGLMAAYGIFGLIVSLCVLLLPLKGIPKTVQNVSNQDVVEQ